MTFHRAKIVVELRHALWAARVCGYDPRAAAPAKERHDWVHFLYMFGTEFDDDRLVPCVLQPTE